MPGRPIGNRPQIGNLPHFEQDFYEEILRAYIGFLQCFRGHSA